MINSDHPQVLDGVLDKTTRRDNTRAERIKAVKYLLDQGWELSEAVSLLGIEMEWLTTPDPEKPTAAVSGVRYRRRNRNGPVSL